MGQPTSDQLPGKQIYELAFEYITLFDDPQSKIWGDWKEEIWDKMEELCDQMEAIDRSVDPGVHIFRIRETMKMVGL